MSAPPRQFQPNSLREPARSGPILWECRGCPRVLGYLVGDSIHIKHERREITISGASYSVTQKCNSCGTINIRQITPERPSGGGNM